MRQRGSPAERRRNATLDDDVRAREEEVQHLVAVRLPAIADRAGQPIPGVGLLDERLAGTAFGKSLDEVMERFAGAVDNAQSRADQSAKAALKASMRALQGLANEQQVVDLGHAGPARRPRRAARPAARSTTPTPSSAGAPRPSPCSAAPGPAGSAPPPR